MDPVTISLLASGGLTLADKLGLFGGGAPDYESIARRIGSQRIGEAEASARRAADDTEEAVAAAGGGASAIVGARDTTNRRSASTVNQARAAADESLLKASLQAGQQAESQRQNALQGAYGLLNGYLTYQGLQGMDTTTPVTGQAAATATLGAQRTPNIVAPGAQMSPLGAGPAATFAPTPAQIAAPPTTMQPIAQRPPVSLVPSSAIPAPPPPSWSPVDFGAQAEIARGRQIGSSPYQPTMIYREGGMLPSDDPPRRMTPEELRRRVEASVEGARDARRPSLLSRFTSTPIERRQLDSSFAGTPMYAQEERSLANLENVLAQDAARRDQQGAGSLGRYRSLGQVNAGYRDGGMLPDGDDDKKKARRDAYGHSVNAELDRRHDGRGAAEASAIGSDRDLFMGDLRQRVMDRLHSDGLSEAEVSDALYATSGRGHARLINAVREEVRTSDDDTINNPRWNGGRSLLRGIGADPRDSRLNQSSPHSQWANATGFLDQVRGMKPGDFGRVDPWSFREGGMLPAAAPIPGTDAVEVVGPSHEEGGVAHSSGAEVEGGETIDEVAVDGAQGDYVFSDAVTVPDGFGRLSGLTFADAHKMMLDAGATDDQVSALASMQETTTGRA